MLERFLRYVRIDTQGAYRVPERPSTEKQLELSRLLVDELRELGLDAELTEGAAVFSGLPGIERGSGRRAHRARRHDARRLGRGRVRRSCTRRGTERRSSFPATRVRCSTRSSSPSSPRGSVTTSSPATERRCSAPTTRPGSPRSWPRSRTSLGTRSGPRAPIRVAFTVDEEVGRGAEDFDLDAFGADVAYTLDGSALGELETETFSAIVDARDDPRALGASRDGEGQARERRQARRRARRLASGGPAVAGDDRGSRGIRPPAPHLGRRGGGDRRLHRARPRRRAARGARSAPARSRQADRRARAARARRDRAARLVPQHAARTSSETRASSRLRSRRSAVRASSRGSRSRAAGRTARCSPRWAFRRRTSSRAARSTTRCASGRACRTWARRPRRSSSSPASGPNRRRPGV